MSSKIPWPKRSQNDRPPTINDGRSTTDLSGEINRLNRNQPGTSMSTNIIYECKNKVYGDQQSENTDNAPILKRLLYRAHEENFYETAQDSPQTRYDVEQPGTSNQKRDIMGPQVENFEKQPDQEMTAPNAINLAISWIDGRAKQFLKMEERVQQGTTQQAHPGCSTRLKEHNIHKKTICPKSGKSKKLTKKRVKSTQPIMRNIYADDIDDIVGYLANESMENQIRKSWVFYQGTREGIGWKVTLKLDPPEERIKQQEKNITQNKRFTIKTINNIVIDSIIYNNKSTTATATYQL